MSVTFHELGAGDVALIERFHAGIYLDAFATQQEPLEAWLAALRGEASYAMRVQIARDGEELVGGITSELYPASGCGFVTYLVVAPTARERGLGRQLFEDAASALYARGAHAVLAEVNDPRVHGDAARPRLERFIRWGARVLDARYVQPCLGPGLARDRGLCLIALPPVPAVTGARLRTFLGELYAATEGPGAPDAELSAVLDALPAGPVGWRDQW